MNDESLKRKLRELGVPPVDDAARQKALHRAEIAFLNRPPAPETKRPRGFAWWKLALGFACAAMAAAFLVFRPHPAQVAQAAPDTKLFCEMEALFPGQIDSVVEKGNDVALNLTPAPSKRSPQPLEVILKRGAETIRVLTYSGNEVCVELGGRKECFEPLVTGEGRVILTGDHFVWSEDDPRPVAGFSVGAKMLSL